MSLPYWSLFIKSLVNTLTIYLPSWLFGTLLGIVISYLLWITNKNISKKLYICITGLSFTPVAILIPYFIRNCGILFYIYPLLSYSVFIITTASLFESFEHTNKYRTTLLINYNIKKYIFFWKVVFRESLPHFKTTVRQTISLSFAIFIAIDYFQGSWKGLGYLVCDLYYQSHDINQNLNMIITIIATSILGIIQVTIIDFYFKNYIEFRRFY